MGTEMFDWRDYGNGIVAFDAGYVRPILAAIHVVVEAGRVAFIAPTRLRVGGNKQS